MPIASDTYPVGQCTYYIATRFPALYGYMGNASQWIKSAQRLGYPVIGQPMPDTIAVFAPGGQYSQDGHVAVVDSVNGDGTYNVSEMNFGGWDQVDQRRVTPGDELGFIVPPGSMVALPGAGTGIPIASFTAGSTGGGSCVTSWNIFGASLCMDGIIGGAAMAAGGFIMLVGIGVIVALAVSGSKIGKTAQRSVGAVAGPAGAVVALHQSHVDARQQQEKQRHTAERTAAAESHQDAMRRSQQRISRAKARTAEATARNTRKPRVVEDAAA